MSASNGGSPGGHRLLSADDILSAQDLTRERVHVPHWNGDVWVRALTLGEQDMVRGLSMSEVTFNTGVATMPFRMSRVRAYSVALGAIHEDGSQLFTVDQAEALDKKNAGAVDLLFSAITRLSGMTPAEVAELEGNSEAVPSGDLSTV